MNLYHNLKSDLYKSIHTPLWLIHLIIPIMGICMFLAYYSVSVWDEIQKLSAYIQILSVTFPVLIGIITSMAADAERNAGNFQQILFTPTAKYTPHLSKLILLVLFGFFSSVLALVGFGLGFMKMGYTMFEIIFYFKVACLLTVSVLPLYLLHYIISFVFGNGFGIGLGIIGGLLSALLLTGLGDGIWWMLPWGIASRFSHSLLQSILENVEFLRYNDIIRALLFILFLSIIFTVLFLFIFQKWQGRKSDD